jgi:hypothetical protein
MAMVCTGAPAPGNAAARQLGTSAPVAAAVCSRCGLAHGLFTLACRERAAVCCWLVTGVLSHSWYVCSWSKRVFGVRGPTECRCATADNTCAEYCVLKLGVVHADICSVWVRGLVGAGKGYSGLLLPHRASELDISSTYVPC